MPTRPPSGQPTSGALGFARPGVVESQPGTAEAPCIRHSIKGIGYRCNRPGTAQASGLPRQSGSHGLPNRAQTMPIQLLFQALQNSWHQIWTLKNPTGVELHEGHPSCVGCADYITRLIHESFQNSSPSLSFGRKTSPQKRLSRITGLFYEKYAKDVTP